MTTSKFPARPSLESLRKQAKKLARGIVAGHAGAIARARAQLPHAEPPLSQRDAQLVLAREYGFPGWQDLVRDVKQRLGRGLEWAVSQARRRIHDNDIERLRQLGPRPGDGACMAGYDAARQFLGLLAQGFQGGTSRKLRCGHYDLLS